MVEETYTITHLPSATVLSDTFDVEEIYYADVGTGETRSATLVLNSENGKFVTQVPILDELQKFRIQSTDDDGGTYDEVFKIDKITPVEDAPQGEKIKVELLGLEDDLRVNSSFQFFFDNAFDVAKAIVEFWNADKKTLNVTVVDHDNDTGNKLAKWTSNIFDFNFAEVTYYDALVKVVDTLSSSVANLGAGDIYELRFQTKSGTDDQVEIRMFPNGSNASPVTITDTISINPIPAKGGIESRRATISGAWGGELGTFPPSLSEFNGELEAFTLHPQHIASEPYPQDAFVQKDGVHYQANTATADTPPSADWTVVAIEDVLGSLKYSDFTDGLASVWKNSGSNPDPTVHGAVTGFNQSGCWDGNLVIDDVDHSRVPVQLRTTTDNFSTFYKYGASTSGEYEGLRVLVDGIGTGGFAGNDPNGVAFTNNVAQYNGTDWFVFHVTKDDEQVDVIGENKVYERQSGVWVDVSGIDFGNDPFHIYTSLVNNAGINTTPKGAGTYGDTSAIEVQYDYTTTDGILGIGVATPGYSSIGAWVNWSVPNAETSHNGQTLGANYGNNATRKQPAVLDSNNMFYTKSGFVGFNNPESDWFGPLNALNFFTRLTWTDGLAALVLEGDFKMRCVMYDIFDNVVTQDFTISFNDRWQFFSLPLSGFSPYRARAPLRWGNVASNLVRPELEVLNHFEFRKIKRVCWQTQEVYDELGRYKPENSRIFQNVIFTGAGRLVLQLDGFHFGKPLFVTSSITSDYNIQKPFLQLPHITNYKQLKQATQAELEIDGDPTQEFEITTEGRHDIAFGDLFYLHDENLVNASDFGPNTIGLIAKKVSYSWTKPPQGQGGFLRTIRGVKKKV